MTLYAYYNSATAAPSPVLGIYDSSLLVPGATPPNSANLLEITPQQQVEIALGSFAVSGGALVAYTPTPPVPTFTQQAQTAMNAGLAVTLSGSMTLTATAFPVDPITTGKIAAVITTIIKTGMFLEVPRPTR